MNKDTIAYLEFLKEVRARTEAVTEKVFATEYQMFAGTRSEIKNASDVDKLLALNHFLRLTIKEFYNKFLKREEVTWLYDYVKKYKLDETYSNDLYLINKWYNEFTVKNKFNPENKTNYAETVTQQQLLNDIETAIENYKELKEISKYVKEWNINFTPAGLFGVNKVEMVSKNLKASYPNLAVPFSLAYNLAKDNDMLDGFE